MKIDLFEKHKRVLADEGMCLTQFKEGDNILKFTSFKIMYMPLTSSTDDIREITQEENDVLVKKLEDKIKELEFLGK